MTLWRRPRSPDWVELDERFNEMSRRIDRALEECRRDMRRFEESFFPASRYGEAQKVINDDRRFAVTLDVSQFHPDEVKVNLDGRDLVIEGRQEHKSDRSYSKRHAGDCFQIESATFCEAVLKNFGYHANF
ncbi:hypothetical protein ANCCEY_00874 [Ancylostoma ceylanicum]|uniref:SHSP domain-containing protein n=2 Tax=Ancylostoma ceylanicum TaxID=53326 RepID=A0A0D6MB54_9BILA|nr:hypothetical protein ANCCEY_00874 [Ancylostoma ceylanicum]EYC30371.1 hypothetical protein Y032_0005g2615 [Ancylostoma ceylanicum]